MLDVSPKGSPQYFGLLLTFMPKLMSLCGEAPRPITHYNTIHIAVIENANYMTEIIKNEII